MMYRHPSLTGVRHSGSQCAECEARDVYGMLWRCRSTSCVLYRHPSLTGVRQEYVMARAVPSPLSYRSPSGVRHDVCCTVTPLLQEYVRSTS